MTGIGLGVVLVNCRDMHSNPNFREYYANLYDTIHHSGRLHGKPQNNKTHAI
jgi:hypothetical protein